MLDKNEKTPEATENNTTPRSNMQKFMVQDGRFYSSNNFNGVVNLADGAGEIKWSGGTQYIGPWKYGKRHGHGKQNWPDGQTYDGQFQNDMRNGNGKMMSIDESWYNGEWKDNMRHG